MRAYYPSGLTRLYHVAIIVLSGWALLACPKGSRAQNIAPGTPSAVKGTVGFCTKTLWSIRDIPGCQIVEASQDDKERAIGALEALNRLVKSDEFKAAILAANFDPAQMKQCESETLCGPQLTKDKVYELMVSHSPQMLNVIFYHHHWPDRGNQGFEHPTPPDTVYANYEKIKESQGLLASLMLHEWMHILGFRHDNDKTHCRSVPYEMNVIYALLSHSPQLHLPSSDTGCSGMQ